VLKNKLGLRKQAELSAFEALSVAVRAEEPLPTGRLSSTHYCAVHRHLFQDVYGWAGRYRTVRMTKDRSPFCFPENIAGEMRALFARLHGADLLRGKEAKAFAEEAAAFLAYLNAIHPFREGNGRTQLTFTALLAAEAGHPLELSRLDPARFLQAMIASFFGDEAPLGRQLRNLVLD
jgi:cell filamentation protein, protein adenylyltransferase